MRKRINFIWVILLFLLVFHEAGLCQSYSRYALIHRPVWKDPLICKLTKSVAEQYLGGQLFINNESATQGCFIEATDTAYYAWSIASFHLDPGWNRIIFQECKANWIRGYGERGSGTNQFLWPARIDCIAPCYYGDLTSYVYYIYVADASNDRIVKLKYRWWRPTDPDYQIITWNGEITGGGLDLPKDLDINDGGTFYPTSDNYLWVLNGHEIKRFTLDGVLRKTYGSFGCDGAVGHFCRPTAVACGRDPFATEVGSNDNDIYVADDGNHRIVWLRKSSGSETISWIGALNYDEEARIVDLEVDNSGHIWAIDGTNGRIYKYTSDLYPLCLFEYYYDECSYLYEEFYYPQSFSYTGGYLDCGNVFVAESWTSSSGGQYFVIGTDVLDFEVTSSVDYQWHYINYTLIDQSVVTIKIYDEENQLIKTLFNDVEYSGACTHVWDGSNQSGQQVSTGDYKVVLIDSSMYWDIETGTPVNVVTKEAWVFHCSTGIAPSSLPGEFPIKNSISNFSDTLSKYDGDSVELAIDYTTAYPGRDDPNRFVEISVRMKNPVPISSFTIQITLDWWELINFHTVDVYPDSTFICPDWVHYPVRECYIETTGSLISNFEIISAHGEVGDTSLPDCKVLTVVGIAYTDSFIDPDPNFRLLFKFGVDLFCMCDAETARNTLFLVSPEFSGFGDPQGLQVPFKYYMGEVVGWWSVPGDASNDSAVNTADVIELVNYVLLGGAEPCIWEAADPDSSCIVNIGDIIYMTTYLYGGGPPPKRGCACPYKKGEQQTSASSK
jgi:hypothetical protein